MSIFYRRIRGMLLGTSVMSSRSSLLSARTCVSAEGDSSQLKPQELANPPIAAEVAGESELRKMVEKFKFRCRDATFRRQRHSYADMVRRLTFAKKFPWIEEILEDQKQYMTVGANEAFIRVVIALYGKAGMFDHALKLFDEMPHLGYNRTVKSLISLLEACFNSGRLNKIEEIFGEIPRKLSITPDLVCYTILIKAYKEMGSLDSILSTMMEMKEKNIKPDSSIYALLLDGYYKNGRVAEGEDVWDLMKINHIAPCIQCYNSKLRFLASEKRMKEALELFGELVSKGLKPDKLTFCALFQGFRAEKNLVEAKRWWNNKLPSKVIRYCYPVCEILVPFATEMGDFEFARKLCSMAIKWGAIPEEATLQGVLDALVRASEVEKARELLDYSQKSSGGIYTCVLQKLPLEE